MRSGAVAQGQAALQKYLKRRPDADDKAIIGMMIRTDK